MKFYRKALILLFPIFLVTGITNTAKADDTTAKERTVKVTGEGKVRAMPDQAEINVEVQEEGTDLAKVSASAQDKMREVFQTLKTFGIEDKDIQTTSYNIQPKVKYDKGEAQRTGYTVSNSLQVVVKKIGDAGKILDAVANDGVSRVDGPSFGFSDPQKLQIGALKAAVEDAQAKAEALAQTSGAELGKVFSITQTSASSPIRPMRASLASVQGNLGEVPIATGENEVTAQVEVVYSLK